MKSKKVLPLILLLFVAIMILSVGMIAKEYRERQSWIILKKEDRIKVVFLGGLEVEAEVEQ